MTKVDTQKICEIALKAGELIMEVYASGSYDIVSKEDESPVTKADLLASDYICKALNLLYPQIPVLSEEGTIPSFEVRKNWKSFFLVDPLDGTKEFINKTGDFTVNIAYIVDDEVCEGIVYAPVKDELFYTQDEKSYKVVANTKQQLPLLKRHTDYRVVTSRSHPCVKTIEYIENKRLEYPQLEIVQVGSSLKMCLIAQASADLYPRVGMIMEWDTAAAQAIVEQAGGRVIKISTGKKLKYNKEKMVSEGFLVEGKPAS
ncbi:MAG: 3'(2'),5'-bisphosphate nucleotidase CysQ [Halobacteriovoraceae bacterium]|jgi:3'(2'), 5'-bisphosphate nucleotidase|nr:3'(2'),5'-bisphosphate nucleotidase CysQ [Halobacteriovoraceae bacterium]